MGCANGSQQSSGSLSLTGACPDSHHAGPSPSSQKHSGTAGSNGTPKDQLTFSPDQKDLDPAVACKEWTVMRDYRMTMKPEDIMGEGTSSICRKGTNVRTGEKVAIKVYKTSSKGGKIPVEVKLKKFRRQVQVLQELQLPFNAKPADPRYWCDRLAETKPSRLFMRLIDFSKDSNGEPGPDPDDGVLYIVTELAQYSLKDYLALRHEQGRPFLKDSVRNIAKAILLVMAGLHAKGLVHIDMKPENLMMFHGRLKLIDVDGCVKAGSQVSIEDSSISFSPCYCAPEWAKFLIEDQPIIVDPALDCWSIGMTLCELITLEAILKPIYANFLRNGHSHREAAFLFMDWLSGVKSAPLSKAVEQYDPQFLDLLNNGLCIVDAKKRKTCAEALQMAFIADLDEKRDSKQTGAEEGAELKKDDSGNVGEPSFAPFAGAATVPRRPRLRPEDQSKKASFKGILWKLNSDGNPMEREHWLKRDMWITDNGSLSYWSVKENKRLVLIGGESLAGAKIQKFEGGAMPHALEVKYFSDDKSTEEDEIKHRFAAETEEEYNKWIEKLRSASALDDAMCVYFGEDFAADAQAFRKVKNRRLKINANDRDEFAPVFKAKLWKLKVEGNRLNADDWFEREMWVAKNGSLVYWSKKEERELVYYTSDDIDRASIKLISDKDSWRPFTFQVELAPLPGQAEVQFAAGDFAAESEEMRDKWICELTTKPTNGSMPPGMAMTRSGSSG